MYLEYARIHGIYRVDQAEYVIYILVAASQEYVSTYSTRRILVRAHHLVHGRRLQNIPLAASPRVPSQIAESLCFTEDTPPWS